VEQVAVSWILPIFKFANQRRCVVDGRPPPPRGSEPLVYVNGVTPSFLPTLHIRLLAGRNFTDADSLTSHPVVIINETMAHALFPGDNPLGHHLADPSMPGARAEIVGVIPDQSFAITALTPATHLQILRPLSQETWNHVTISLRATAPEALGEPMRRVVAELDPDLAVQQTMTVDELIDLSATFLRLMDTILVTFSALGLFLSALGLYGVIVHLVTLRTREIGVRVALGAQPRDVVSLLLRSGLRLTLIGAAIGLAGAIALARLITAVTPELPFEDPITIGVATLLLLFVALLACWLPSRRATRIDPITALRAE
jgi:predicted permease